MCRLIKRFIWINFSGSATDRVWFAAANDGEQWISRREFWKLENTCRVWSFMSRKDIPDLESISLSVWDDDKVFWEKYESGVRTIRCLKGLEGDRNQYYRIGSMNGPTIVCTALRQSYTKTRSSWSPRQLKMSTRRSPTISIQSLGLPQGELRIWIVLSFAAGCGSPVENLKKRILISCVVCGSKGWHGFLRQNH